MNKIRLADNTELNIIQTNGASRYFQGQNRDSLEFVFEKDAYAFSELDELFADRERTCKITIIDDSNPENPQEFVYDDYSLRVGMEMKPVVITPATTETQGVTEERVTVTMAQLTYIEKQLEKLGVR